jgi:hypothetical protein
MLQRSDVEKLARTHAVPAVTILLATDRHRPGNGEDPRRLRSLVDEACERLQLEYGMDEGSGVQKVLRDITELIDWKHPSDAIAMFATGDSMEFYMLPFTVHDRVAVAETFATRELLRGLQRTDRYRVVTLSGDGARLFEGYDARLYEVADGGFPIVVEAPVEVDTPHRDLPIHENRIESSHDFVFRAVDRALDTHTATEPLPLVVVAVERDLGYFDDVTAHSKLIIGRVHGNYSRAPLEKLESSVAPIAQRHFHEVRVEIVREVERAVGAKRAAVGMREAWKPAVEGRGRILVVDDGYEYLARVRDGELHEAGDDDGDGGVHDAVDDIVDAVIAHDGDVVIVAPGALGEYGPIALVLRY